MIGKLVLNIKKITNNLIKNVGNPVEFAIPEQTPPNSLLYDERYILQSYKKKSNAQHL